MSNHEDEDVVRMLPQKLHHIQVQKIFTQKDEDVVRMLSQKSPQRYATGAEAHYPEVWRRCCKNATPEIASASVWCIGAEAPYP